LGLTVQSVQTNVTDSDRGLVLEPIQEVPADNTLVESSEQPEPDRIENFGDDILTSSIEQPDVQRTDVSDALANQPRSPSDQVDIRTE
jgi:hypothetical protein